MAEPSTAAARPALMPLDELLQRLLAVAQEHRITALDKVDTFDALGRVLARPVSSALDVPPADNSAMDGYALRLADLTAGPPSGLPGDGSDAGALLPVSQRLPAGVVGQPLQPGTAVRIFTGAQLPPGADAVVMQEQCEAVPASDDVGLGQVRIKAMPETGAWVRRRGEDVMLGDEVLHVGQRLSPQALGLAASVGASRLAVCRRPRVALFSTGDELVMPGEALKPGAIYNSNRFTLRGLLLAAGCVVDDLGIVPDRLDATRDALRRAAQGNDLILTSGGVSVGEEDHVKPALKAEGWIEAWQVAMKPGKPLLFGAVRREDDAAGQALFMGLPGNPVSSFVTFLLAVAPVLRAMQGMPAALPQAVTVRADFDLPKPDKRREFLRARFNGQGGVEIFPNQSSGVLTSAVWADGLIDNPGSQAIRRGDSVQMLLLSALIGS